MTTRFEESRMPSLRKTRGLFGTTALWSLAFARVSGAYIAQGALRSSFFSLPSPVVEVTHRPRQQPYPSLELGTYNPSTAPHCLSSSRRRAQIKPKYSRTCLASYQREAFRKSRHFAPRLTASSSRSRGRTLGVIHWTAQRRPSHSIVTDPLVQAR
jgi:hypothetical protein